MENINSQSFELLTYNFYTKSAPSKKLENRFTRKQQFANRSLDTNRRCCVVLLPNQLLETHGMQRQQQPVDKS